MIWLLPAVLLAIGAAMFLYSVVALARNQRLYRYRMEMLDAARDLAMARARASRPLVDDPDLEGPFDEAVAPDYGEMVRKVWRTFDSFYPEDSAVVAQRHRRMSSR